MQKNTYRGLLSQDWEIFTCDGKSLTSAMNLPTDNPYFDVEYTRTESQDENTQPVLNSEYDDEFDDIFRTIDLSSLDYLDITLWLRPATPRSPEWSLIRCDSKVSGVAFCLDDGRSLVFKGKHFSHTDVDVLNKQFPRYSPVQSVFGGQFERLFNGAGRLYMVRRTEASEFTIDTLTKASWSRSDCSNINRHSEFMDKFIEGQITRGSIPKWIRFEGQAQTLDSVAFLQFLSNPA